MTYNKNLWVFRLFVFLVLEDDVMVRLNLSLSNHLNVSDSCPCDMDHVVFWLGYRKYFKALFLWLRWISGLIISITFFYGRIFNIWIEVDSVDSRRILGYKNVYFPWNCVGGPDLRKFFHPENHSENFSLFMTHAKLDSSEIAFLLLFYFTKENHEKSVVSACSEFWAASRASAKISVTKSSIIDVHIF